MHQRLIKFIFPALLLWFMVVLGGYYFTHKPISLLQSIVIIRLIIDVVCGGLITFLAGGVGRFIWPRSRSDALSLDIAAIQAAIGFGVLGIFWLGVGLIGGYHPVIAWSILILGQVVFFRESIKWVNNLRELRRILIQIGRLGKLVSWLVLFLIVIQLFYALTPPVKWDALMYHLELPRHYIASGNFSFQADNPYWGNPPLAQMLYTWSMLLHRSETATFLGAVFILIFCVGLLGMVERWTDAESAWVALGTIIVASSFRGQISWGYADGLAALFGFATLSTLLMYLNRANGKSIWMIGLLVGLGMWSKLTVAILVPVTALGILILNKQSSEKKVYGILKLVCAALFVFLPWILVTTFYTGNPIYPYLFPTHSMSAQRLDFFSNPGSYASLELLWLPVSMTWNGLEGAIIHNSLPFGTDIGPLLISLGVPGILFGWKRALIPVRIAALFLFGGWFFMAIGSTVSGYFLQTRLYFSLLPGIVLAAGFGWYFLQSITLSGARVRRILGALFLMVLFFSAWQDLVTLQEKQPLRYLTGSETKQEYLTRSLGSYAQAMEEITKLPFGSRVLFLWEPRGYYAPITSSPDILIDRWFLKLREFDSADVILESWKQEGYSHLLLYRLGKEFDRNQRDEYSEKDWQELDKLLEMVIIDKSVNGDYELYQLP